MSKACLAVGVVCVGTTILACAPPVTVPDEPDLTNPNVQYADRARAQHCATVEPAEQRHCWRHYLRDFPTGSARDEAERAVADDDLTLSMAMDASERSDRAHSRVDEPGGKCSAPQRRHSWQ